MAKVPITAKFSKSEPVTVTYDFGEDDAQFLSKFSEKVVCSYARAGMRIALQDLVRAGIKAKKSAQSIQKEADDWKPGIRKRGKSKAEKIADQMNALTPDEKKTLLAKLTK